MNCPYYTVRDEKKQVLVCWRGLMFRIKVFTSVENMDKHEREFCNNKYTQCRKYRQLEDDWGKE